MIDHTKQPWFRQPGETDRSYNAFELYRDAGPTRSIREAAAELGYNGQRVLEGWSAKHRWVERARAYDAHNSEQRLLARDRAREDARQVFVDHAAILAKVLVALGTGAKSQVNKAQVQAIKEALDRAGVQVVKEVKISGDRDAPIGVPPALWDARLEDLAALAGIDLPELAGDEEE